MQPGEQIGRFVLEAEVGRGEMGVVWRARDSQDQRPVALKFLVAHSDEKARARFEKEAAAAARLTHPNIAALYEFGEHAGHLYMAMEWVEGTTLAGVARLAPEKALDLCDQVASALDYAHGQGVVHRDVKPANLLREGQRVVLVDFGLASLAATPLYLAPEIARGETADGRCDQYSLAAVLYELVTGKPPFTAASTAGVVAEASEVRPDLPRGLDGVLARGLAKQPSARYATCTQLCAAARTSLLQNEEKRVGLGVGVVAVALLGLALAFGATPVVPPSTPTPTPVAVKVELGDWLAVGGDASRSNVVTRLAPLAGKAVWDQPATRPPLGALTHGERLFVVYDDGAECRESGTGRVLWGAPFPNPNSWTLVGDLLVLTGPRVQAFHQGDGRLSWTQPGQLTGLVSVTGGLLGLTETSPGLLVGMEVDAGVTTPDEMLKSGFTTPPCATQAGLFGASGALVVGLGGVSRDEIWKWQAPGPVRQLIASYDGLAVLAASGPDLAALSALSGKVLWKVRCAQDVAGLACEGDHVVIAGQDGILEVRDPANGKVFWETSLGEPFQQAPAIDGTTVRVVTDSGTVRFFDLEHGKEHTDWSATLPGALATAGSWVVQVEGQDMSLRGPR